jgi:2,3-bisphosphoglycerate-independent phosphoglycerate mutase
MTHDELLEELNYAVQEYDKAYDNTNYYYTALRAVVELHKPVISQQVKDTYPNDSERRESEPKVCEECSDIWEMDMGIVYPCSTIEAIEKELG